MKAKNAVKYFIKAMVIIAMIFMLPVAKKGVWAVELPDNLIILKSDGSPATSSVDYTITEYTPSTHIVLNSDDLVITCNGTVNMGNYRFILSYNEDFFTVKIKDLKLNGASFYSMFDFCVGNCDQSEAVASKGKMIVEGDCEICCVSNCIYTYNTLNIVPADSDASLSLTSYDFPAIVALCNEAMADRTLTLGDDSDNAFNITINSGNSVNKNTPALCNDASDSGNAVLTVKGNVNLTCTNEYADDSDNMRLIYGFEEYKFYGKVEAYCKCGPALEIKNNIYVDEDAVIKLRTGSGSTSGAVKNIGSSVLHKITFTNPGLYGAEASTDDWNAVNGEVILWNERSGFYSKMVSNNMIAKTVVIMHRTVSDAFGDYLDKLREALDKAIIKSGEQTIYWNEGTALPYDIMKTISENPNITLVFTYTYENDNYKVVLNGKNVKAYTDIPWYGPLYLNMYYRADDGALSLTGRSYVVQKGDTLSKLAVKLHTTVSNLVSINSIENPNFIRVGQIINY